MIVLPCVVIENYIGRIKNFDIFKREFRHFSPKANSIDRFNRLIGVSLTNRDIIKNPIRSLSWKVKREKLNFEKIDHLNE